MIDESYCAGRPCDGALTLSEVESMYASDSTRLIAIGFTALDRAEEIAGTLSDPHVIADVRHTVQEILARNETALQELVDSRDFFRSRAKHCETCIGLVNGTCPTFPLQAQSNTPEAAG